MVHGEIPTLEVGAQAKMSEKCKILISEMLDCHENDEYSRSLTPFLCFERPPIFLCSYEVKEKILMRKTHFFQVALNFLMSFN